MECRWRSLIVDRELGGIGFFVTVMFMLFCGDIVGGMEIIGIAGCNEWVLGVSIGSGGNHGTRKISLREYY